MLCLDRGEVQSMGCLQGGPRHPTSKHMLCSSVCEYFSWVLQFSQKTMNQKKTTLRNGRGRYVTDVSAASSSQVHSERTSPELRFRVWGGGRGQGVLPNPHLGTRRRVVSGLRSRLPRQLTGRREELRDANVADLFLFSHFWCLRFSNARFNAFYLMTQETVWNT